MVRKAARPAGEAALRHWRPLPVCGVLVPLVLAGLALFGSGQAIEDDLTERSREGLTGAGLGAVGVTFDGRDAVLTGVPGDRRGRAVAAVTAVDGVRVAEVVEATGRLELKLAGGSLVVSGLVPDPGTRGTVLRRAGANAGDRKVVDRLTVTGGVLPPGNPDTVGPLVAALAPDVPGERGLTWNADGVRLTGEVPDDAARTAVNDGVAAALPGIAVHSRLESAKAKLQARIAEYLAANPIEFRPDSASLTANGRASVDHVAALLNDSPEVPVRVDGHVAPGRPKRTESTPYQRGLSERRAGTVKAALVALGVAAERITTRGLGQDGPNPGRRVDIAIR